jgi:hypothetical protein
VPNVNRARGQLLKSGYLPIHQDERYERWVSASDSRAAPISFIIDSGGMTTSCFKVEGETPDRPEFDDYSSFLTPVLRSAIVASGLRRRRT